MAVLFLDTSGLVKRYVTETGTAWVQSITETAAGNDSFIAQITGAEMVSAVTRRLKRGQMTPADAAIALAKFKRILSETFSCWKSRCCVCRKRWRCPNNMVCVDMTPFNWRRFCFYAFSAVPLVCLIRLSFRPIWNSTPPRWRKGWPWTIPTTTNSFKFFLMPFLPKKPFQRGVGDIVADGGSLLSVRAVAGQAGRQFGGSGAPASRQSERRLPCGWRCADVRGNCGWVERRGYP